MKNLRWRVITILVVVGLAIWAIIPPDQKIKLGLDLKGGVHLVLRVQTDDALRLDTDTTMEQLREAAEGKGLTSLTFTGVDPDPVPGRGRAPGPGRGVPRGGHRDRDPVQPGIR